MEQEFKVSGLVDKPEHLNPIAEALEAVLNAFSHRRYEDRAKWVKIECATLDHAKALRSAIKGHYRREYGRYRVPQFALEVRVSADDPINLYAQTGD